MGFEVISVHETTKSRVCVATAIVLECRLAKIGRECTIRDPSCGLFELN